MLQCSIILLLTINNAFVDISEFLWHCHQFDWRDPLASLHLLPEVFELPFLYVLGQRNLDFVEHAIRPLIGSFVALRGPLWVDVLKSIVKVTTVVARIILMSNAHFCDLFSLVSDVVPFAL